MKNFEEIMNNAENTIDTLIDEKARRRKYMDRQHKEFKEFVEQLNEKYQTDFNKPFLTLVVANDYVIAKEGEYFRYRTLLGIGDIVFSICPSHDGTLSFWLTIDGEDEHQYEEPLMKRIAEAVIKSKRNVR